MRTRRLVFGALAAIFLVSFTVLMLIARPHAHRLVTNPSAARQVPGKTPADFSLPFIEVAITNNGFKLVAWYLPSANRAAVLCQHGYRTCREEMLPAAAVLNRHGYGVLVSSIRAHDHCDGEQITFGFREVEDLDAWLEYLGTRPDLDATRLGALGNSMGGSLVIQLAARNPRVKAVVADSAFSSLRDTLSTSVTHFTGLPPFPFAPMVRWWAEMETGAKLSQIDAKIWIRQLSPRPVFLMQGGGDVTVSRLSGQRLYAAAAEPKELWYDPSEAHAHFASLMPAYEQRVVAFFDKYLLSGKPQQIR